VFSDDPDSRTLTLKCAAISDELNADPITEIDAFQALAAEEIHNDGLLNGGSKLQIGPIGTKFSVTTSNESGTDVRTWDQCALKLVKVNLDSFYFEDENNSLIEYELVIVYQTYGSGGVDVYTPDFDEYTEIDYYLYSDQTNPGSPGENYGKELGYMVITSTSTIWKVEVLGTGDCATSSTDCWLEVNGQKEYWHYTNSGDKMAFGTNILPIGTETLEYILDTPSSTITLQTSSHIAPDNTCDNNKGCWITRIRLYKE